MGDGLVTQNAFDLVSHRSKPWPSLLLSTPIMSSDLPLSPSFVSLSTATTSSVADDVPPTPKVRFDQECVLIPDPLPMSRMPRLVTKSYSLPLWKRKRSPSVVSESEDEPLEDHVVFKVSVPRSVLPPFTIPHVSEKYRDLLD